MQTPLVPRGAADGKTSRDTRFSQAATAGEGSTPRALRRERASHIVLKKTSRVRKKK